MTTEKFSHKCQLNAFFTIFFFLLSFTFSFSLRYYWDYSFIRFDFLSLAPLHCYPHFWADYKKRFSISTLVQSITERGIFKTGTPIDTLKATAIVLLSSSPSPSSSSPSPTNHPASKNNCSSFLLLLFVFTLQAKLLLRCTFMFSLKNYHYYFQQNDATRNGKEQRQKNER